MYQVTVEAAGFEKEVLKPFALEVLQMATFHVTMKVGATSTTVNVTNPSAILSPINPTPGLTDSCSGRGSPRSPCSADAARAATRLPPMNRLRPGNFFGKPR